MWPFILSNYHPLHPIMFCPWFGWKTRGKKCELTDGQILVDRNPDKKWSEIFRWAKNQIYWTSVLLLLGKRLTCFCIVLINNSRGLYLSQYIGTEIDCNSIFISRYTNFLPHSNSHYSWILDHSTALDNILCSCDIILNNNTYKLASL